MVGEEQPGQQAVAASRVTEWPARADWTTEWLAEADQRLAVSQPWRRATEEAGWGRHLAPECPPGWVGSQEAARPV